MHFGATEGGGEDWRDVMMLDTFTIIFMTATVAFLVGVLLAAAWYHDRDQRSLGWWSASYFLKSVGCALLLPRGVISDLL